MLRNLRRLFLGLLTIVVMSGSIHGTAKAQNENFVSYRCDLKKNQIVLTYNDALPGDKLGVNRWGMDSLWTPASNDQYRSRTPIIQTCRLSSGIFEIKISPNGNPDIQGMCGADPSAARVEITFAGKLLFDTDFNDEQCMQNAPSKIIDKIDVDGKTKKISIYY